MGENFQNGVVSCADFKYPIKNLKRAILDKRDYKENQCMEIEGKIGGGGGAIHEWEEGGTYLDNLWIE